MDAPLLRRSLAEILGLDVSGGGHPRALGPLDGAAALIRDARLEHGDRRAAWRFGENDRAIHDRDIAEVDGLACGDINGSGCGCHSVNLLCPLFCSGSAGHSFPLHILSI